MKYKLDKKHPNKNLYRVVALKDFFDVKKGDIGGWGDAPEEILDGEYDARETREWEWSEVGGDRMEEENGDCENN